MTKVTKSATQYATVFMNPTGPPIAAMTNRMKTDSGMNVIQPSYGFPDVCMAVRYFSGAK